MALNYKKTLMVIGNRLVQEHGFLPSQSLRPILVKVPSDEKDTSPLAIITEFFNTHPEAQQLLHELGGEWPMPEPKGQLDRKEIEQRFWQLMGDDYGQTIESLLCRVPVEELQELVQAWEDPEDEDKSEVRDVEDMTEQEFKERNDAPWET
jgi:hypothetical protein